MKLQNRKGKEKIFSEVREKRQLIFKDMTSYPDSATTEARRQQNIIFHALTEINSEFSILFLLKKNL